MIKPIFLHYAKKDSEFAKQLCEDLERSGLNSQIWIDYKEAQPGSPRHQSISTQISDAAKSCRAAICVISRNFLDNERCDYVMNVLSNRLDSKQDLVVIPLMYELIPLPKQFANCAKIDFSDHGWRATTFPTYYLAQLHALLDSLSKNLVISPSYGPGADESAGLAVFKIPTGGATKVPVPQQVITVDQRGPPFGVHTITEALAKATSGSTIHITPGTYNEAIRIDKELHIRGIGERLHIVVEAHGTAVLVCSAQTATVTNLCLRQKVSKSAAVEIMSGALMLEANDIATDGMAAVACVAVHGNGTAPTIRRNKIYGGILVYDNAIGTIAENDIIGGSNDGVEIREMANPTVLWNKIHDSRKHGLKVTNSGRGVIEANEFFSNDLYAIVVAKGCMPRLNQPPESLGEKT